MNRALKIVISCLLAVSVVGVTMFCEPCRTDAESEYGEYGFAIEGCSTKWSTEFRVNVRSETGDRLGTMTYVVGVASNDTQSFLLTKETMTPNRDKVRVNNKMGYGISELVSVKGTLPTLDNYSPTNHPQDDRVRITAGYDDQKKSLISCVYETVASDLDISSLCDTPSSLFYMEYDYLPSKINWWANNRYVKNESSQYSVAEFTRDGETLELSMQYDVEFGFATTEERSPISIDGKVYKVRENRPYTFYF